MVSHVSSQEITPVHNPYISNLKHKTSFATQNENTENVRINPSFILNGIASRRLMDNESRHSTDQDHRVLSTRRVLGDFDELNAILKSATFTIPDFYTEDKVLWVDLNLWASDLKCSNIQIDDIILEHEKKGDTEFTFSTVMDGLSIDCDFEWR